MQHGHVYRGPMRYAQSAGSIHFPSHSGLQRAYRFLDRFQCLSRQVAHMRCEHGGLRQSDTVGIVMWDETLGAYLYSCKSFWAHTPHLNWLRRCVFEGSSLVEVLAVFDLYVISAMAESSNEMNEPDLCVTYHARIHNWI